MGNLSPLGFVCDQEMSIPTHRLRIAPPPLPYLSICIMSTSIDFLSAHRHKHEGSEEQAGPIGSLRINGSQIQSKVEHVSVSLTSSTTVAEVLKDAVKQFALQVGRQQLQ